MPELMAEIVVTMNMISAGNPAMPKKNVDSPDLPEGAKNFILAFNIFIGRLPNKKTLFIEKKVPNLWKNANGSGNNDPYPTKKDSDPTIMDSMRTRSELDPMTTVIAF